MGDRVVSKKINIAVLISGRGSNMVSILKACEEEDFPARVAVVLSNKPDTKGLDTARQYGIATEIVPHKDYGSREEFDATMVERIKSHTIDLVCLAGFMRVLTPVFITAFPENRILNIHPSLLPDYKGLHTHQRVLEDGRGETGCTVHYVVPELDSGPIIVQKRVAVMEGDTAESLGARVLEQEHIAYPEAISVVAGLILSDHT